MQNNERRAELWDAINDYVVACGGSPGEHVYGNVKRQQAVEWIEAVVLGLERLPQEETDEQE